MGLVPWVVVTVVEDVLLRPAAAVWAAVRLLTDVWCWWRMVVVVARTGLSCWLAVLIIPVCWLTSPPPVLSLNRWMIEIVCRDLYDNNLRIYIYRIAPRG